jgi:hypothetical protein
MATTDDLLQRAARNNAEWCDAVCRAHGRPGEFREVMWINRHGTPRFYPNLVTLAATADPDTYVEGVRELVAAGVPGDCGVKDSFAALDLAPLGFRLLFDAQWIARAASAPGVADAMPGVRWLKVERARELADWESAWAGVPVDPKSSSLARVFLPTLLADDDVAFIAAYQGHRLVAGAIANRAADVVGWSNLFVPTAQADQTHRQHAIIETTFADLIDGPLARIPSGLFSANCAWLGCAVIAHNLLRAAGTLAGGDHTVARGATLRRDLVNVPARFAAPARKPMLHLPAHWPWQYGWKTLWDNVIGYYYPTAQPRAA